jgi:hypothetical protein
VVTGTLTDGVGAQASATVELLVTEPARPSPSSEPGTLALGLAGLVVLLGVFAAVLAMLLMRSRARLTAEVTDPDNEAGSGAERRDVEEDGADDDAADEDEDSGGRSKAKTELAQVDDAEKTLEIESDETVDEDEFVEKDER